MWMREYRQRIMQLSLFTMAFFLLALVGHVYSQTSSPKTQATPAGQVVWVKGTMKAIGANQVARTLERRGVVYAQDTIETDGTSSGEIVFSDNTLMSVNPDSEIKISQYQYSHGAAPSQDKYIVNIAKGGFRTISGAIAKSNPDNYQVNTPVATIGVRGTQWGVNIIKGKVYLKIEKGQIVIVTPKGKLVLDKDKDKLYATIDMLNPVPMQVNALPPGAFSKEPTLTPAQSTLTSSTTNVTNGGTAGSGTFIGGSDNSGGSGGIGGGSSSTGGTVGTPPGSTGGSSTPVSGFCIQ